MGLVFSENSECFSIIFIVYGQKKEKGDALMDCMKELMKYSLC